MPNMWRRKGHSGRVDMLSGKDLLVEGLQRRDLRYKTSHDIRSEFLIKFLPSSLSIVGIGCIPKTKKVKGTSSPIEKPTCGKCGKKHYGNYLKRTDSYFCCGKCGNKVRDFPNVRGQDKDSGQAQSSSSNESPKKNHFYARRSWGEQETSPDVMTCMLKAFSIDVYTLIYPVLHYHLLPLYYLKSFTFCTRFCMNLLECLPKWVSKLLQKVCI